MAVEILTACGRMVHTDARTPDASLEIIRILAEIVGSPYDITQASRPENRAETLCQASDITQMVKQGLCAIAVLADMSEILVLLHDAPY
jgi:hypothetical protein